jgi:peptidoglycan/xylan/chitin deacetylase (PgdA/CDA1 family)
MKLSAVFACGVAAAGLLAAGCGAPSPELPTILDQQPLTTGQINGSNLPSKTVVLTYDDGPDEHTLELARYLNEQGVRATFFVNGRRFCKTFDASGVCTTPQDTRTCMGAPQAAVQNPKYYPESLLDEVRSLGHRIANHTQDHCHLPGQTNAENLIWEVKATQDILDRHICDGVFLFRAPYGEWDGTVLGRLGAAMGLGKVVGPINWDVDGNDWDCWRNMATPQACANRYLGILNGRPSKNGIFLMHDRPEFNVGYEGPLAMTKILVPTLKAMDFKFATMDEVLKIKPMACPAAPADAGVDSPIPGADGPASEGGGRADGGGSVDAGGSQGGTGGSGAGGSGTGGSGTGGSGTGGSGTGGSYGGTGGSGTGGSAGGTGGSGTGGSAGSAGGARTGGSAGGGRGGSSSSGSGKSGGCSLSGRPGQGAEAPWILMALGGVVFGLRAGRRRGRAPRRARL